MSTPSTHLISDPAVNLARRSLYRFASIALADPRGGTFQELERLRTGRLLDDAAELIREEPAARAEKLAPGELQLSDLDPRCVLEKLPATSDEMESCFQGTFGLLASCSCPPYETEYIDGKFSFQRSNAQADVAGFYLAFGLQATRQPPERPDNIVLELEFMACLLALEHEALMAACDGNEAGDRAAVCRDAQARFLRDHLAWWVPVFATLLQREHPDGLYAAVGKFLAALIPAERAMLGIAPPSCQAQPSTLEPPEACDGCLLADS